MGKSSKSEGFEKPKEIIKPSIFIDRINEFDRMLTDEDYEKIDECDCNKNYQIKVTELKQKLRSYGK